MEKERQLLSPVFNKRALPSLAVTGHICSLTRGQKIWGHWGFPSWSFRPERRCWPLWPRQVNRMGLQGRGIWDAKWLLYHLLLVPPMPGWERPVWNGWKAVMCHNKTSQRGMVGQEDTMWWLWGNRNTPEEMTVIRHTERAKWRNF